MTSEAILSEAVIVSLFREEWEKKKAMLQEATQSMTDAADSVISAGLKVTHKYSGVKCTVITVSPSEVTLKKPEGGLFTITGEQLEKDYELA